MGFGEAITSGFRHYAGFNGRASRSEFWYWQLFYFVIQLPISIAIIIVSASDGPDGNAVAGLNVLNFIFVLALLLPSFAVIVRRLHDVNKSGWWYFIILTIVGIIPLFVWICTRGDGGPNKYGEDPLGAQTLAPTIANSWET